MADLLDGCSQFDAAWTLNTQFGFSVFPLEAREKRPVVINREKDIRLGWKQFQTKPTTEQQLETFKNSYPDCNWAVVCGEVSDLVVVDCDAPESLTWAEKTLVHTPWKVKTGKGWHLYYHYPKGTKIDSIDLRSQSPSIEAEIKSDGVYVVAPQSIHESGAVYTLHTEGAEWDWVPEFGYLEDLNSAVEEQKKIDPNIDLSNVEASFTVQKEPGRNNFLARYCGRLYAAGKTVEEVEKLAWQTNKEWCDPPLSQREVKSVACSIYRTHKRNHPEGTPAPQDGGASVNLTDYTGVRLVDVLSEEDAINTWPEELLHPGGLLEDIMNYTASSNRHSHPIYNLAGAITVLSTIAGRKVRTETKLTTNMYCTVLGKSGSGKDAPKKSTAKLLYWVHKDLFGGNDVASAPAVYSTLEEFHRCCFVFDEFGLMLKACKKENSPKGELVKGMTEIFSCYDSPYVKPYKQKKDRVYIPWLNLCVLGLSVPDEFWAAMQDGEATNGAIARHLLFEYEGKKLQPNRKIFRGRPISLISQLKKIWQIDCNDLTVMPLPPVDENGFVIHTEDDKAKTIIEETECDDTPYIIERNTASIDDQMVYPYTIFMTEEASEFFEEKSSFYDKLIDDANGKHATAKEAMYSRFGEHAMKLALLKAVSRVGSNIVEEADKFRNATKHHIELEDIRWACLLVETTGNHFIHKLETTLYSSQFEQWCNDTLKAIRSYIKHEFKRNGNKKPGAPREVIERALHIPSKTVQEVIDKLANMNTLKLIENWKSSNQSKRPMSLYCIVEDLEQE